MKIFRNFSRILIGLVFVFSGFVKGVDPMGTAFRMEDYFSSFNLLWAIPSAIYLSVILCALEFITGISMLFNLWVRKTSWLLLFMMIFFTVLTFFDAFFNLVPDCGCFGDAVKLTNMQTFIKNIILMVFTLMIFIQRKKFKGSIPMPVQRFAVVLVFILFAGMSVYSYRHLPFLDFLGWKKGEQVNQKNQLPLKFFVKYRNQVTGEEKEYLAPNYPWNDSVWLSQWIFVNQRVEDPNKSDAPMLRIEDESFNDITPAILDNPGYQFLFVSYDLEKANQRAFLMILPFYKEASREGCSFVCLTSSLPDEIQKFKMVHGTSFDYFMADDVMLKTMIRSNPGLILLKNGKVLGKWGFRDIPDFKEVMKEAEGK